MEKLFSDLLASLGGPWVTIVSILIVIVVFFMLLARVARMMQSVAPNTALIVYGPGVHSEIITTKHIKDPQTGAITEKKEPIRVGFKIYKGGMALVLPFQEYKKMDLSVATLDVSVDGVMSTDAVPLTVDGVAQLQIGSDDNLIATAAVNFLSTDRDDVFHKSALQTLQGHLRAIVGTMKANEVYRDREGFRKAVIDVAVDDLFNLGLKIVSFNLREISDKKGYLASLGEPEIQAARQKAEMSKAVAEEQIVKAQQDKDQKIAEYKKITAQKQADADIAGPIQKALLDKQLEQNKTEAARYAAERANMELEASVRRPADAKAYEIEQLAKAALVRAQQEAEATKVTGTADGEASRARGVGEAEAQKARLLAQAEGTRAQLNAEAEGRRKMAEALTGEGGQMALRQFLGDKLLGGIPDVARAFAQAFVNVKEIRLVDIGNNDGKDGGPVQKFFDLLPTNMFKFLQGAAGIMGTPLDDFVVGLIAEQAKKHGIDVGPEEKQALKPEVHAEIAKREAAILAEPQPESALAQPTEEAAPPPAPPVKPSEPKEGLADQVKQVVDDASKLGRDVNKLRDRRR